MVIIIIHSSTISHTSNPVIEFLWINDNENAIVRYFFDIPSYRVTIQLYKRTIRKCASVCHFFFQTHRNAGVHLNS